MNKIETHRARVPWSWVGSMTAPWLVLFYIDNVADGGPLTFTIRKFVESPTLIALLSSVGVAFSFTIGVVASYMSDRIWTRWGRRRPFLIVGWTGVAVAMFCLPLAPTGWVLAAVVVGYHLCAQFAKPLEPLYNEVIPPNQRGRAASVRNIGQQLLTLFFFGVLLAQFDSVHEFSLAGRTFRLDGEKTLYWAGSALIGAVVLFLALGVRETPAEERPRVEPFVPAKFLRDVFGQRQWWWVYLLYATPWLTGAGGGFGMLMKTEQLGFSKADVGFTVSFGTVVTMVAIAPLGGYLVDHMSRMRLLQLGLIGPAVAELGFFVYLRYVADYTISLPALIGFSLLPGALKTCAFLVWGPLVFDYIPRNRFGTVSAGLTFVSGAVLFLTTNLAGFWISRFTALFGETGGSRFDYSSLLVLQFILSSVALGITFLFERAERRGSVVPLGRQEIESVKA